MAWVVFTATAVRAADLLARGQLVVVPFSGYSVLALVEIGLPVAAAFAVVGDRPIGARRLFVAAAAVLVGGGLYRLDTALIAFMPGAQYRYFPAVAELMVTVGFTSAAVAAYILIVKRFAILPARLTPTASWPSAARH
jgi:Ni/Fe-hydrogenase subunit HybB-like protein